MNRNSTTSVLGLFFGVFVVTACGAGASVDPGLYQTPGTSTIQQNINADRCELFVNRVLTSRSSKGNYVRTTFYLETGAIIGDIQEVGFHGSMTLQPEGSCGAYGCETLNKWEPFTAKAYASSSNNYWEVELTIVPAGQTLLGRNEEEQNSFGDFPADLSAAEPTRADSGREIAAKVLDEWKKEATGATPEQVLSVTGADRTYQGSFYVRTTEGNTYWYNARENSNFVIDKSLALNIEQIRDANQPYYGPPQAKEALVTAENVPYLNPQGCTRAR